MHFISRSRATRGAALVEYGLLVGLVSVAAIAAVAANGEKVREIFEIAASETALPEDDGSDGGGAVLPSVPVGFQACGDQLEIAGESYGTVAIGSQCWTTRNLNAPMENSMCYANNPANCETYGRLYWNQTQDQISEICPDAWRLPNDGDWWRMMSALGYYPGEASAWKRNGAVDEQIADWTISGTNSSGFSAQPGGYANGSYGFQSLGSYGAYLAAGSGAYRMLARSTEGVYVRGSNYLPSYHMSARCVVDID